MTTTDGSAWHSAQKLWVNISSVQFSGLPVVFIKMLTAGVTSANQTNRIAAAEQRGAEVEAERHDPEHAELGARIKGFKAEC